MRVDVYKQERHYREKNKEAITTGIFNLLEDKGPSSEVVLIFLHK